jgi:hypothetical protein
MHKDKAYTVAARGGRPEREGWDAGVIRVDTLGSQRQIWEKGGENLEMELEIHVYDDHEGI